MERYVVLADELSHCGNADRPKFSIHKGGQFTDADAEKWQLNLEFLLKAGCIEKVTAAAKIAKVAKKVVTDG